MVATDARFYNGGCEEKQSLYGDYPLMTNLPLRSLRDFFVYSAVSAVFYHKEHKAGAKSTKIFNLYKVHTSG